MEKDKNQASASTNYEIPKPLQKAKRQQIEVTKINNHFYIPDATDPDAQIYYNVKRANSTNIKAIQVSKNGENQLLMAYMEKILKEKDANDT